ncbi:hypothetical protein HYY69_03505 [Candidatus Woesearchaeota archaeon]|nr:hypothetical protein [Candidatus Woesearchaeota archaeon]
MSKRKDLEALAVFIGLWAAHRILVDYTNHPESIKHLQHEEELYALLSSEKAAGNWNSEDIDLIKELAVKRCSKKLDKYQDIKHFNDEEIICYVVELLRELNLR